jgi:DNA polymerase beta
MGFCQLNSSHPVRRIDIRLIPLQSYWPALLYFTGPFNFNQKMRLHAKKMNYKLNEYGLFPNTHPNKQLTILSEHEIFDALNLKYVHPTMRF